MMTQLPVVTGSQAIRIFESAGFRVVGVIGSHHVMKKTNHPANLSIPVHGNKPLDRGTLRKLIHHSGLTVDEFVSHL